MKRLLLSFLLALMTVLTCYAQRYNNVLGVQVRQSYKSAIAEMKEKATFVSSNKDEFNVWSIFKGEYMGMDCEIEVTRFNSFDEVRYLCVTLPSTYSDKVFMDVYKRMCNLFAVDCKVMSSNDSETYVSTVFRSNDGHAVKVSGGRPFSSYEGTLRVFIYPSYSQSL